MSEAELRTIALILTKGRIVSLQMEESARATMVNIVYPENRSVNGLQILMWASDALHNGETSEIAENLQDAIRILEDLGQITVDRRITSGY